MTRRSRRQRWTRLITAAAALRKVGVTPWGYGVKNLTGIGNFSGMFNTQNLNDPKELLPVVLGEQKYTEPKFSEWLDLGQGDDGRQGLQP